MAATFGAGVGVACVVDVGDQVVDRKQEPAKKDHKKCLENFCELR